MISKLFCACTYLTSLTQSQLISSVMGIFPILMNIIQFWLIDSIVKASSMAAVALDIEHGAHDSEPLFQGGSDDEDNYHPSRSEAPDHRLSNSSSEPRRLGLHDNLSFTIPTQNDANDQSEAHAYPPSLSSSMTSNAPTSQAPRIAKNLMKQSKQRSSQPETSHLSGPSSISQLPRQHHPVAPENADWTDSWDDADEWGHRKSSSINDEQWKITSQSIQVDS